MYWTFILLFVIAVLVPDIVRGPVSFLVEERVEEIMIFLLGTIAFLVFLKNEKIISFHKKQKEKDQKKINQTVKDLVESYSYIGEVNRKIDILMGVALGLTDRSILNKKKEREIYESIISAANFLLKAEHTCLRFIDVKKKRIKKEVKIVDGNAPIPIRTDELTGMKEDINVIKSESCLVVSSPQMINGVRSFLIICEYDHEEEERPKNIEILKLFASQAIFLYSYIEAGEEKNCK